MVHSQLALTATLLHRKTEDWQSYLPFVLLTFHTAMDTSTGGMQLSDTWASTSIKLLLLLMQCHTRVRWKAEIVQRNNNLHNHQWKEDKNCTCKLNLFIDSGHFPNYNSLVVKRRRREPYVRPSEATFYWSGRIVDQVYCKHAYDEV